MLYFTEAELQSSNGAQAGLWQKSLAWEVVIADMWQAGDGTKGHPS